MASQSLPRRGIGVLGAVCCLLGPALALGGTKINYADPPQGVFADEWMALELANVGKAGYAHSEVSRQGDHINTYNLMSFSLARMGQPVCINVLQMSKETLKGAPVEFSYQLDASQQRLQLEGAVSGRRVSITSTQFGVTTTSEYDFPDGALMAWGMLLEQHRRGLEPGTKYTLKTYDPMTAANSALEVDVEVHGREELEVQGRKVSATRVTQVMKLPAMPTGVQTEVWIDGDWNTVQTSLNMIGLSLVMTRTTKAEALAEFSPPEFFAPTTIKVNKPIDRAAARTIEYVLRPAKPTAKLPPVPKTGMQKPAAGEDGSINVVVRRLDHDKLKAEKAGRFGSEFEEFLKPNTFVNSDDPAVKEMAAKAKGDAKAPYEIADNLRKYVTDVITEKNLNIGFATASEVCRNKEGDCSEHGVLLAALGRACGLPSRVVAGLVYVPVFGGQQDIFGFHMWTQFRIGDQWVDFDAAQGESDCNATHIAFVVDSLAASGIGQIALPLVNVIGNLQLEVIRVEPPGGQGAP